MGTVKSKNRPVDRGIRCHVRGDFVFDADGHLYCPGAGGVGRAGDGSTLLTVTFSIESTADPDGDQLRYAWDFAADGRVDSSPPGWPGHHQARTPREGPTRVVNVVIRGRDRS